MPFTDFSLCLEGMQDLFDHVCMSKCHVHMDNYTYTHTQSGSAGKFTLGFSVVI